jgi:sortase A
MMKLRRRISALIIIIGAGIALFPFLQQAYGAYSQWQLERQWDDAVRKAQQSQTTKVSERSGGSDWLAEWFGMRTAEAATAPQPSKARRIQSSTKPLHRVQQPRHTAKAAGRKVAAKHVAAKKRVAAKPARKITHRVARAARTQPMGLVRMEIPRLKMRAFVVDGTSGRELARGPAHFTGTALPGQTGNCAIAAHRNVYGSWFRNLNRLRAGDLVILRTPQKTFNYKVTGFKIIPSNDLSILKPTKAPTLTLVTCMIPHAVRRLVVFGKMM